MNLDNNLALSIAAMLCISEPSATVPIIQRLRALPGGEVRYTQRRDIARNRKSRASVSTLTSTSPFSNFYYFHFCRALYFCTIAGFSGRFPSIAQAMEGNASNLASTPDFTPPEILDMHRKIGSTGYGVSGAAFPLSRKASQSIRYASAALEQHFGIDNAYFLTGTLPGSTDEALHTFACWSGWLMDRLQKWLRKHYCIDGSLYHLGVWEFQARGALHYHALIICPDGTDGDTLSAEFSVYWLHLLKSISDFSGCDIFARSYGGTWADDYSSIANICSKCVKVEKSISAYLSKYLSKGGAPSGSGYPSRWWACTRAARDLVSLYTIEITLPQLSDSEKQEALEIVASEIEAANPTVNYPIGYQIEKYNDDGGITGISFIHIGFAAFGLSVALSLTCVDSIRDRICARFGINHALAAAEHLSTAEKMVESYQKRQQEESDFESYNTLYDQDHLYAR